MVASDQRLFVTGAGGRLGRRVVEHLLTAGVSPIVAGTRNPGALADFAARGVDVRRADFDEPATLDAAFAGVDRILIISTTDTPQDRSLRLRQHRTAVDAAVKAGVGHILYTSMQKPEPGSPIAFARDHYETEQAIVLSGIPFTILRPTFYADAFFMWLPPALATGKWLSAAGEGKAAYVWRDDLARTAAAALRARRVKSCHLDVSGPDALTPAEIVATVNAVFGTNVSLAALTDNQYRAALNGVGLSPAMVDLLVSIDINTRQGGLEIVSDTVGRLTGNPSRSLRAFLTEHRSALIAETERLRAEGRS